MRMKRFFRNFPLTRPFCARPEVRAAAFGEVAFQREEGVVAQSAYEEGSQLLSGEVHDLAPLYRTLNQLYFGGTLALSVRWFAERGRRYRRQVTLGQYHYDRGLIQIHRLLDDIFFPEYFLSFVLYHEMLHAVEPGYRRPSGRWVHHTPAFKARERLFLYYEEARAWEQKHRNELFTTSSRTTYGRS